MTGIEADADAGLIADQSDSVAEVLESATKDIAAGCHVLEERHNSGGLAVCAIDVRCEVSDCRLSVAACGVRYAWMEIVQFDAESLATIEVVEEGIVGLLCSSFVCMREVDQV